MEPRLTNIVRVVFVLSLLLSTGSSESDRDLKFCGIWRHGNKALSVNIHLTPGCDRISILAHKFFLSIYGQITNQCRWCEMIPHHKLGIDSEKDTNFCLYWEPLRDQLTLQLEGKNHSMCSPAIPESKYCTHLSDSSPKPEATYGIVNGMVRTDLVTNKTRSGYEFKGESIKCGLECLGANHRPTQLDMNDAAAENAEDPCANSVEVEMKNGFKGFDLSSPIITQKEVSHGTSTVPIASVHLPPALKEAAHGTSKVRCTLFQNISLFQEVQNEVMILNTVVEITVENTIIVDLPEPIRIGFSHDPIPKNHFRKCVSWDNREYPLQVNWLEDGCVTKQRGEEHTECHCNHLTYFSVLVQMQPRPMRHLLALTVITSLGCIVSVISCIALIIYLCRKSKQSKEQSLSIHLGLATSLALLNLLFFFTGTLANVGGEKLCTWVGAGLHYALLSSFSWMGIEVFHTFWLVYKVFNPLHKGIWKLWIFVGFGLPAFPTIILAGVGNIYGERMLVPSDDVSNPYRMCWMKSTPQALLAHYFTNMTLLVILVLSGTVMLVLVYRKIHHRDEWKQSRVAFLSIWGLSCLFGTSWGLTFLDFGPLSDFVHFLSCILNSFQGFLLILRFSMLERIRKHAGGSSPGSNSTGSTRQHMLHPQEKS